MFGKLGGKDSLVLSNTSWKHVVGGLRKESFLHTTDLDEMWHTVVALNVCITVKEIACKIGGCVRCSGIKSYWAPRANNYNGQAVITMAAPDISHEQL
jgi:hypothetical protein